LTRRRRNNNNNKELPTVAAGLISPAAGISNGFFFSFFWFRQTQTNKVTEQFLYVSDRFGLHAVNAFTTGAMQIEGRFPLLKNKKREKYFLSLIRQAPTERLSLTCCCSPRSAAVVVLLCQLETF
jgi:hypothetical protein